MNEINKIESIYDEIENYLDELTNNMQASQDAIESHGNKDTKEGHLELKGGLEDIVKSVSADREHLRENSEWKVYTIAFYGETNAGKSTLIEALRIFFKEVTKQESWGKFDSAKNIYEASKAALESLENEKKTIEESIPLKEADIQKIQTLIRQQGIVNKILAFFGFGELSKQKKKLESEHSSLVIKAINIKSDLESAQKTLDENVITLNQYSDGGIIGDGRSDFTQSNVVYEFFYNKKRFNIIDVPGIEGNEKDVIEEISKATKKAHCVFYVTPNPTPPQKGDDNQGTLEKIKEHLGSQTEVYTIYNKKINNPIQLESNLISENESKSLAGLDSEVKNILGEHYKGRSNISARPAFLALAEYISPLSNVQKEKDKFLSKLSKDEILNNAKFNDFISFMDRDLIQSEEALLLKIKQSNYNKLEKNLEAMRILLEQARDNVFKKIRDDFQNEVENTSENIDSIIGSHQSNFLSAFEQNIREFKNETSSKIYKHIDRFIDNKEFKAKFEEILDREKPQLEEEIAKTLEYKMQAIEED